MKRSLNWVSHPRDVHNNAGDTNPGKFLNLGSPAATAVCVPPPAVPTVVPVPAVCVPVLPGVCPPPPAAEEDEEDEDEEPGGGGLAVGRSG